MTAGTDGKQPSGDKAATGNLAMICAALAEIAIDATTAITSLVEAMHRGIKRPLSRNDDAGTGLAALPDWSTACVGYHRGVGFGVDAALKLLAPALRDVADVRGRDSVQSIINGAMGDYLQRSGNPLAIEMQWRAAGQGLAMDPVAIARALAHVSGKLLIMVHGLCMNDHAGSATAKAAAMTTALPCGVTSTTPPSAFAATPVCTLPPTAGSFHRRWRHWSARGRCRSDRSPLSPTAWAAWRARSARRLWRR